MKVSIITGTYNSAATIADCVTSIQQQTYNNIEHIIIDGASKDKTVDLIKSLPNRVAKIISEPDNGIYDAMNKGISLATGDIVGILNSDDLYQNELVIEKVVQLFKKENTSCVHADLFYVNKDDVSQVVRSWKTCDYVAGAFTKGWHPAHPTFFVKKEVYEKYGSFNLDFKLAADFELMLRLLERDKITSAYLPEPIVRMRVGGATGKNLKNIINQNIECFKAFKVNGIAVSPFYTLLRILPKMKQFFHA